MDTSDGNTTPGLDIPAVVLSLTEQDLFDYCRIVINEGTKKPRSKEDVQADPRFQEFRVKIVAALEQAISEQQVALQKQEDTFRGHQSYRIHTVDVSGELDVFETDKHALQNIEERLHQEHARVRRIADILSMASKRETAEEKEIMIENAKAAIQENTLVLEGVVGRLRAMLAPSAAHTIEEIRGQEKDSKRSTMIQELLSGVPVADEQLGSTEGVFSSINDFGFRANNMLISGVRTELIARTKQGDGEAKKLVKQIRILKNTEEIVRGFERMVQDIQGEKSRERVA